MTLQRTDAVHTNRAVLDADLTQFIRVSFRRHGAASRLHRDGRSLLDVRYVRLVARLHRFVAMRSLWDL